MLPGTVKSNMAGSNHSYCCRCHHHHYHHFHEIYKVESIRTTIDDCLPPTVIIIIIIIIIIIVGLHEHQPTKPYQAIPSHLQGDKMAQSLFHGSQRCKGALLMAQTASSTRDGWSAHTVSASWVCPLKSKESWKRTGNSVPLHVVWTRIHHIFLTCIFHINIRIH